MASKNITIYLGTDEVIDLYAGEGLSEYESWNLLVESDLDSSQVDIQSVPKLFSQGSWVTSARIDFRDITLKANILNDNNKVTNLRLLLDSISYDQEVKLTYDNDGYIKEYEKCLFVSWSFKKVGSDDEFEVELLLRSFDGLQ